MSEVLLQVSDLKVEFDRRAVVDGVSFEMSRGETVALVGESGSGKSTLARALLRLVPAAAGRVCWCGEELLTASPTRVRALRKQMQMVFQNPQGSLNPRLRIGDAIAEPLKIFEPRLRDAECAARVAAMLEQVGLSADAARRYPHEFSGGQCQRIAIARAMMGNPRLLICDEAVSSLDVSVQGQIINLLMDLQAASGLAMLFISHNLAVVRQLSHRVLVMYGGRLVETADRDSLFKAPQHPYTQRLLASVPGL